MNVAGGRRAGVGKAAGGEPGHEADMVVGSGRKGGVLPAIDVVGGGLRDRLPGGVRLVEEPQRRADLAGGSAHGWVHRRAIASVTRPIEVGVLLTGVEVQRAAVRAVRNAVEID